jgi:hypothetical protein
MPGISASRGGGANYLQSRWLGFARGGDSLPDGAIPAAHHANRGTFRNDCRRPKRLPFTAVATPLQVRYSPARPRDPGLVACYHR